MEIKINGKPYKTDDKKLLSDLLNEKKLNPDNIVVEINRKIIEKSDYKNILIKENDIIELISFVGGG